MLIPFVYERVTLRFNPDVDILKFENEEYLTDTPDIDVWAFGTSRAMPFDGAPSAADITSAEFLTAAEKNRLRNYRIIPFALAGSVPAVYLYHYSYARSKGYKPDAVFIDISAFALNRNNLGRTTYVHMNAPDGFILDHLQSFPTSYLLE